MQKFHPVTLTLCSLLQWLHPRTENHKHMDSHTLFNLSDANLYRNYMIPNGRQQNKGPCTTSKFSQQMSLWLFLAHQCGGNWHNSNEEQSCYRVEVIKIPEGLQLSKSYSSLHKNHAHLRRHHKFVNLDEFTFTR